MKSFHLLEEQCYVYTELLEVLVVLIHGEVM